MARINATESLNKGLARLEHLFGYHIESFSTQDEWKDWRGKNPLAFSPTNIAEAVDSIFARGAYSAWLGLCPPSQVVCRSKNYRESLSVGGFNPRQRVVLDILAASFIPEQRELTIYAPEYVTRFAGELRKRFSNFIGSEYVPDQDDRDEKKVPHQDLAGLSLKDSSVDVVVANEVFEHLPSLDKSISEIHRVLRRNGVLIATVPFLTNSYESRVKAALRQDGEIEYFTEPEYHGNPVDPKGGSLVFQIPGWDLLDNCRRQGFPDARMYLFMSVDAAMVSVDINGIMVLIARKK